MTFIDYDPKVLASESFELASQKLRQRLGTVKAPLTDRELQCIKLGMSAGIDGVMSFLESQARKLYVDDEAEVSRSGTV